MVNEEEWQAIELRSFGELVLDAAPALANSSPNANRKLRTATTGLLCSISPVAEKE